MLARLVHRHYASGPDCYENMANAGVAEDRCIEACGGEASCEEGCGGSACEGDTGQTSTWMFRAIHLWDATEGEWLTLSARDGFKQTVTISQATIIGGNMRAGLAVDQNHRGVRTVIPVGIRSV